MAITNFMITIGKGSNEVLQLTAFGLRPKWAR